MAERNDARRAVRILQVALIAVSLAAFFFVPRGVSSAVVWTSLIIFYVTFWAAIRRPQRMGAGMPPTFVTFEVLFLVFYYILFYLPYQLYAFGRFDLTRSAFVTYTFAQESNPALICATLGLVGFSLGIGMISSREPEDMPSADAPVPLSRDPYRALGTLVFVGLTGFIVVYLGLGLRSSGEGRYSGTAAGGVVADGLALIITTLSMAAVAVLFARLKNKQPISFVCWLAAAIALFWALRILLLGDRNNFLLIAVVLVAGLFTYRVHAGRVALAVLMLAALLLYNAVQVARESGSHSLGELWSALVDPQPKVEINPNRPGNDNSFDITTIELRATFVAVPGQYPYGYGRYTLIGIAGIVPFSRNLLIGNHSEFVSTDQPLTTVAVGPNPGYTIGTNVLSDLYINFGIVGVPAGMFLIGLFAGAIRRQMLRRPTATEATVLYLATLSLYAEMPRYAVDFPVRSIAWLAALFWLTRLFNKPHLARGDSHSQIIAAGGRRGSGTVTEVHLGRSLQ